MTPSTSRPFVASWPLGLVLLLACLGACTLLVLQQLGQLTLPRCGPESHCARLASGPWARIGGWPVSFLGLAYFAGIAASWIGTSRDGIPTMLHYYVRMGAMVTVVYTAIMVMEGQYCVYCLVIHTSNLFFWLLVELSPRKRESQLRAMLTACAISALVSSLLLVTVTEQKRLAKEKAEVALHHVIEKLSTTPVVAGTNPDRIATVPASASTTPPIDQPPNIVADETSKDETPASNRREPRPYRLGQAQASIQLTVFNDYQCRHCRQLEIDLQILVREYGDKLSITTRHYPMCSECNYSLKVNRHPNACRAALAAEAAGILAGNDGFWRMHRWLFRKNGSFTDEELRKNLGALGFADAQQFSTVMNSSAALGHVLADIVDAQARKVKGTPTVFINGVELLGLEAENAIVRAVTAASQVAVSTSEDRTEPLSARLGQVSLAEGFSPDVQLAATTATVRVRNPARRSTGSGVIVGVRSPFVYVLTASHLVGQARTVTLQTFTADSYPESASINESAAVIARSEDADLAIIRFLADQNVPASLQICPPQRIPETVNFAAVTLGCGLNAPTPEVLQVLGKKRVSKGPDMDPTLVWELSVEQESGRSGGPLVDQHGFVLGILSGTSEGRGFASHTEELHRFLAQNGLQWLWAAKH